MKMHTAQTAPRLIALVLVGSILLAPASLAGQCPEPIGFWDEPQVVFTLPFTLVQFSPGYVADLNADGFDDFIFAGIQSIDYADEGFGLWVLLNDQSGGLVESTAAVIVDPIPSDYGNARVIFLEDFNGDSQVDILVSSHGVEFGLSHGVTMEDFHTWPGERELLYLSQVDKTYRDASAQFAGFPHYTHGSAAGDINNDGAPDFFDAHNFTFELPVGGELWLNDGFGSFVDVTDRMPRHPVTGAIAGNWASILDATGDGFDEILLLATHGHTVSRSKTWINDGTGNFSRYVFDPLGDQPVNAEYQEILQLHLDDDSLLDIVVHECEFDFFPPCYLRALTSNGDGTFRDETQRRFPDHPPPNLWTGVYLVDINEDPYPDLSAATCCPFVHYFFVNDGSGNFRLMPDVAATEGSLVSTLDIDNDGDRDLISNQGGTVFVWRSNTPYSGSLVGDGNCNKIVGGSAVDTFHGGGGQDELLGGDGDDFLFGDGGDDILYGENGNDHLDGGSGTDAAGFRESRRDYTLNISPGSMTVTHRASLAVDTLTDIESLVFVDITCIGVDVAADSDADGAPDGCDLCPGFDDTADADDDGIPDGCDVCAAGDDALDSDEDGVPDACDLCFGDALSGDSDGDGVCDDSDSCPGFADSADADNDSVPDGCDACPGGYDGPDWDDDGITDWCDPCIGWANNSDADSDGHCDDIDLCPGYSLDRGTQEDCFFADGFDSGDTSGWSRSGPD